MRVRLWLIAGLTTVALLFGAVGIVAAQVGEPADREPARRSGRAYGVVERINGRTLVLATPVGSVSALTDDNTVFRVPGVEESGVGDLVAGDYVGLAGWWDEGEVFHAFVGARVSSDRIFPLVGKLLSTGDGTLALDTVRGPATVIVTGDTVYRVPGVEDPGLSDLEEGVHIVARGTLGADGALTAEVLAIAPAPRPGRWLAGRATAPGDRGFMLRTPRGRVPVHTGERTRFRVPGVEDPSVADLAEGDLVAVRGVERRTGPVRASFVVVLPEGVARVVGTVEGAQGTGLAIATAGGSVTVLTDADTTVRIPGVEEAGLDDLGVGDHVVAMGTWDDEFTFSAFDVSVRRTKREGAPDVIRGRAIRVDGDENVMGAARGPVTVRVHDDTRLRVPGVDAPSLDDVWSGAPVAIWGTWNEDGTLTAALVVVLGRW